MGTRAEEEQEANTRCLVVHLWEEETADLETFFKVSDAVAAAEEGDTVQVKFRLH